MGPIPRSPLLNEQTEKRTLKFYIADVFGTGRYSGNQLAVFTNAINISDTEMQQIAREINFSETTFISGQNQSQNEYNVRIFTPGNEVPFAGHPTIGTAYIILDRLLGNKSTNIALHVKAGKIPVHRDTDIMWMKQLQPVFGRIFDKPAIAGILGLNVSDISENIPVQEVSTGLPFIIVPLIGNEAVIKAKVNKELSGKLLADSKTKEFMVFSINKESKTDKAKARVFVEEFGIPEDPATGSANGCLAAYMLQYNLFNSNKISLSVAQGYEIGRPSRIYIKADRQGEVFDIHIGGRVNIVAEGYWY
ncbi:MAG: PhzF family phenazine biosynthesis protein [Bacteroidales bacterium]|nr:PhzF family phenazine biosynthesis protein [Bacteroidales bacterium]